MRGESPEVTEQRTDVLIPSLRFEPKRKGFITGLSAGKKTCNNTQKEQEAKKTSVNEMRKSRVRVE